MKASSRAIFTFFAIFIYAFIRYIYLGPYAFPEDLLHIVNKALAFSSAVLIVFIAGSDNNLKRKKWGKILFGWVSLHVLLSILLFFMEYYEKTWNKNPWRFVLSVIIGLIAYCLLTYVFFSIKKNKLRPSTSLYKKYLTIIIFSALIHVVLWGLNSWFQPGKWYGGLIPITLISSFILITGLIFLFSKKINQQ